MESYQYPFVKEEGKLNLGTSNRRGKKFTIWEFYPANGEKILIDIDVLYPHKDLPLRFSANSASFEKPIENTDIELLRKEVNQYLQSQCYKFNNIEWEEWYEVVVANSWNEKDQSGSINIEYGKLKRGINPLTKKAVTIHNNNVIIPFPGPKKAGEKDDRLFRRLTPSSYSYIPVTPENTKALETIVNKIKILKEQMSVFLSQDEIKGLISKISKNYLIEE